MSLGALWELSARGYLEGAAGHGKFKILDVVGCYDRNPDKVQAKAEKYGIRALTLEEVLADKTIEIVVNLTTPVAHYPVANYKQ